MRILGEIFVDRNPETMPPIQKKHNVSVKLNANALGDHPNSTDKGAFNIDHE